MNAAPITPIRSPSRGLPHGNRERESKEVGGRIGLGAKRRTSPCEEFKCQSEAESERETRSRRRARENTVGLDK